MSAPPALASEVHHMIQPFEMKETRPIKLHDGGVSTVASLIKRLGVSFAASANHLGENNSMSERFLNYLQSAGLAEALPDGEAQRVAAELDELTGKQVYS